MAFLNWFLGDVALPASVAAALCMAFDWAWEREEQWMLLIRSTLLMRHVRAYEKARSRTPGGSTKPPRCIGPQRAPGATGPGVEAPPLTRSAPPPVPPQRSVGGAAPRAVSPTGLPQSPVGGGHTPATPPTGPRTRHV